MLHRALTCAFLLATTSTGAAAAQGSAIARPEGIWPNVKSSVSRNADTEARIDAILARMSIEEKVGQVIQPDIGSITPADVRKYKFGSVLNGGNSSPYGNETGPASDWVKLADEFWDAAMGADWAGEKIPVIWGSDAVHGHSNVVGATLFPHNIGLGNTRNPDLIRRVGEVTAREMVVTGLDWTFAPTLAVVRDDRWGRSYEGYSEDPEIVRSYASAIVEGLQGRAGTKEFLGPGKVIATAKHFIGDGGTEGGKDQGDNPSSADRLRDIHGAGYAPAIEAGVQAIMSSFSSVRGEKVHGSRDLLTGALKEQMNFDGLVVGDWNGHGQVPGCTNESCAASVKAGLDMFMAPDSWKGLYENTLAQVRSGEIPMARLDDAVRRILRVKLRSGVFSKGKPSTRPLAGRYELLGSAEHRAVARQAVRESLVLLKNQGKILPLAANAKVLVAGDGADNIAKQSGGWTLTWQGTGVTNKDFPGATSIFGGIREAVNAAGGTATLSIDGSYGEKPDVAIVVFGEDPYAEFVGDRQTLEYSADDKKDLALLRKLKAAGIPVVSVFLSGRPLWVNAELNASDAFVAAFLPGSEGGGVADMLFRSAEGNARHDFKGKLSFSWPKRADQTPLNRGDADYDPLFPYGFGLTYADEGTLPRLSEERPVGTANGDGVIFGRGRVPSGWMLNLADEGGPTASIPGNAGATASGRLRVSGVDRRAQEDARFFVWDGSGPATASISALRPLDISRETGGELSLVMDYRVDVAPTGPVSLGMSGASVPIGGALRAASVGQWTSIAVPLQCFHAAGADMQRIAVPFTIATAGRLSLAVSDVRLAYAQVPMTQCGRE
ncbi:exo 1,3/1,4-beta-D-glucan glucohydrolase [Allosphingosinicella flava]|uniref:Exo 1,3/1,4-beta-D-glucan glucohydrolase n=1 Tax=Allosphingosinicella flava TaxID=2771430 RepID=A0A7T2GI75_9SPHN|nr:exo 1,3/1,4-beta-D-glucan glucohydrolase [Sphingosinicella flava]QPQ54359.1 exo 1,3/1,4-beta-D-glucan glucohydrolase [Sphingosinicella flava]